jgi:putative DNA primase/helicase
MYEAIPSEMKALPNWVCYRYFYDDGIDKYRKMPINPRDMEPAKSNDPTTWTDYDTAVHAAEECDGIGFMFSNSPYFGVDIDGVRDEIERYKAGEDTIIAEFVDTLQSYTELSRSGNGIHIICRGKLPPSGRRKGNVEMYENGRFFVMTGNIAAEYADISDCTEAIKVLHEKYIGGGTSPSSSPALPPAELAMTDSELLDRAKNAKNGAKFARLYAGDISGYTSQSEADMALCNHLAYWTGCDAERMDHMFRGSGLFREKWLREQSGTTYGALTIQKAILDCRNVYTPGASGESYALRIGAESDADTAPAKRYTFDDMGNAERIFDAYGGFIRYSYTDKRWLYYDTRKWCMDTTGEIERAAEQAIKALDADEPMYARAAELDDEDGDGEGKKLYKAYLAHKKYSRSNRGKKAMLDELRHKIPISPMQTDIDGMLLNTPTGIFDLREGVLRPHDPEAYITKIAHVEYDPTATCPTWERFLGEIFGGDTDLINYVQRAVGYSMTASTVEQCVFFLHGSGSNGKSTFLSIIREMMGDYTVNIQPETIMVKNSAGGANSDIARLKSARLVTTVEPNEGARLNEGLLKQLSGEDPVTARRLYGDEFEFIPQFKLWMATNHRPLIRGTDDGIWRRIKMIPFTVQIPDEKKDKHLAGKLRRELPGIFNWAIEGCRKYQESGLQEPRSVRGSTMEYRKDMDAIQQFIDECCEQSGECPAVSLYSAYSDWAKRNHQYEMNNNVFGRKMSERYVKQKTRNGAVYIGIKLGRA